MPLLKGSSQKIISKNIAKEMKINPEINQKQAIAIAMSTARKTENRK